MIAGYDRRKHLVHFTTNWAVAGGGIGHSRLGLPLQPAVESDGELAAATILHYSSCWPAQEPHHLAPRRWVVMVASTTLYLVEMPCRILLSLCGNVLIPKLLPATGKDEFAKNS